MSSALDRILDGSRRGGLATLGAIVRTRLSVSRIVGRPLGAPEIGAVRALWRSGALYEDASGNLFAGVGLPAGKRPVDRSRDEAFHALSAHRCSKLPETAFGGDFGEYVTVQRHKLGEPFHDGTEPSCERGTERAHPGLLLSFGYRFDCGAGPRAHEDTVPDEVADELWHARVGFELAPRLFVVGVHHSFEGSLVTGEAIDALRAHSETELPIVMATVPERFAALAREMEPHLHVTAFRGRMSPGLAGDLG